MRNHRRLATIGLSIVATGALLAGTASAAPATPVAATSGGGNAKAAALTISIAGQTLSTSATNAELQVAKLAKASAVQVLTPALTDEVKAETSSVGTIVAAPKSCKGTDLPGVPGITRLKLTCGSAAATLNPTAGDGARAIGAEALLEPSVSDALATLQLQGPAQQATSQVLTALNPLVQGLTGTPVGQLVTSADKTVADVLNKILTLKSTARIVIAPALAEVTSDANNVTAHAHAQGIRIELLPVDATGVTNGLLPEDLIPGKPLVTITIGNAEATKVAPKGGGSTTASAVASLVTVEFGSTALTKALGVPDKIEVKGGQSFCLPGLVGTPLETCVAVASAGVDAAGNPYADGATVDLFKGVNGGIHLGTGTVSATAAAPAIVAPALAVPADLPRTGGNTTLPILGGSLLALAYITRRLAFGHR